MITTDKRLMPPERETKRKRTRLVTEKSAELAG
jgi:hypothetical protein